MGNAESGLGHLEVDRDKGEVYEDWTMTPGELDGTPVTVFSAAHPASSRKRPYIERALQASRVYRHPGLLKYLDGGIIGGEVIIVTERGTPLVHQDLDKFSPLHISAGFLSVIDTLVFLHDRAGVSHNNVSAGSIFVTAEGAWKLWGLEYSCSFGELTRDHIEHISAYCHEKCIPPDDKTRISPTYQHARDCYAFSSFVKDILSPDVVSEITGAEDFLKLITEEGLNQDWSKRPRLANLADHSVFSHDFLRIHDNLTNLLLLSEDSRDEFLKAVGEQLRQYDEELISRTLAGALLSRPLLLHPAAASHLMPIVLVPKEDDGIGLFNKKIYERDIIPQLIRLFSVHDATVRSILLSYLPNYVAMIPKDILSQNILPELLLGIRDSSDNLVMSTLHALAHLVPILGANTVIGENRQNLFTTAKPKAAATLPMNKASTVHLVYSSNIERSHLSPSSVCKESEPPPPPPRTISLPPESSSQNEKSEITSLDNISFDSMILSQIPERSSPDGGEDSGSPANMPRARAVVVSDSEAWSDWEEMQDTPSEDFSNVLLTLNKDDTPSKEMAMEVHVPKTKETPISQGAYNKKSDSKYLKSHSTSAQTEINMKSNYPAKQSSGMKLTRSLIRESSRESAQKVKDINLGEEYDVLAIKINKKHDKELDLFADIMPKFDIKKYDLETMLLEANYKTRPGPKERSPSVSETLACLDFNGTDVGDAWEDDIMGEHFDMNNEAPCGINNDVLSKNSSQEEKSTLLNSEKSSKHRESNSVSPKTILLKEKTVGNNDLTAQESCDDWGNWGEEF
ncbi:hypothetical protein SK128_014615 [Halocaridina rubra]|uniref:Protein-associating with the carboxyl-terminal domain of ezrin n=1 Tax=Halocaridina rubra TaxID=373956 RepID=A0AAN9A168_HALRR